jgi:hypothetical protein
MRPLALAVLLSLLVSPVIAQDPQFNDAKLTVQRGDKSEQTDVILRYRPDSLAITAKKVDKDKPDPSKVYPYSAITGAEYSYGKHVRLKAAILVSPLFLLNNSKSHWLTVKTATDYSILRLDKRNYKLVMAELEKRAKIKVEALGEDK